ncbi:pilus assembly protein [Pseudotabrizicola sediminis]|uniref:Pilus assembly protein n=1 Tax=Pseudotabrizicola sediminis TaxID=2486418 RepID=A0ABY2KRD6_9RHOB|nr:TadE/TadG family type IV pilus assembly protein [Pseudotabrizicola sediminis]TGD45337.1 pilus assembly protein [Pseudotabrizicola sediminis]
MTRRPSLRTITIVRRFGRDEDGTTLVELTIVIPVFLLLLFALIDFGRMGAEYVMADKAMQIAARIAVVRPPACPGTLPSFNARGTSPSVPKFGTICSAGASGTVCAAPAAMICTGAAGNPTVDEIWGAIAPLLPAGATEANLSFRYDPDDPNDPNDLQLGFLGGPYVPMVTVDLVNLQFTFVTPLSGLAALAGSGNPSVPGPSLPFPAMSTSLPGEDLDHGENG